ncbi:MAG: hypothetical protein HZA54_07800 [Planctomycetes bacterium]|nr:hypothetical protein [Planctomycetota bacterium]
MRPPPLLPPAEITHRHLEMRLCDLDLRLADTLFAPEIRALRAELRAVGLALRPHFYLSTEYGTIIRTGNIALLWTDGCAWGRRFARANGLRVRTAAEMLITLRHETGHAFAYVNRLYRTPRYRALFEVRGSFFGTYPDHGWAPCAEHHERFDRGEVIKIYAARHPDEDFAICFQTWLAAEIAARSGGAGRRGASREAGWRAEFADRPVILRKLEYVAEMVARLGARRQTWDRRDLDEALARERMTVGEWLRRVKEMGSYNLLPSHPVA